MSKLKLDEIIPEGEGVLFNLDTEPNISNPLDIFINGLLDECAKHLLLMAPIHIILPTAYDEVTSGTELTDDTLINGTHSRTGYVVLPDDFLRLYSFKMVEWQRPVIVPTINTDPAYKRQWNKFLRGGPARPVVILTHKYINGETAAVKQILEYFSVATDHDIEHFLYIPDTVAEDIQANLTDALTWIVAAKVLQITERLELAAKAMEQVPLCFLNM